MIKKLGDKLFLSLQLFNGPEGANNRVFCTLRDNDNTLWAPTFEIAHEFNGFFKEEVQTMPPVQVLFAFFEVRESDGVTVSLEHGYITQRYDRDFAGEQIQSLRPISGSIVANINNGNVETLVAPLDNIDAEVADPEVEGIASEEEILGETNTSEISGGIQ